MPGPVMRLNDYENSIIKGVAEKLNIKLSEAVHLILFQGLNKVDLKKLASDMAREAKYKQTARELRTLKAYYYSIANLQKSVYRIGMSTKFNSDVFDPAMLTAIVDKTKELIGNMPESIQKDMELQLKHIDKYKNVEFVNTLLAKVDAIEMRKRGH